MLQHVEYRGGFADETRFGAGQEYRRATTGRFDASLNAGGRPIGLNLALERAEEASGGTRYTGALRASTSIRSFLVSNVIDGTQTSARGTTARSIQGAFDVSGAIGDYGIRAGLTYGVYPNPALRDLNLTADRRFGDTLVRVGVTQQLSRKRDTRLAASLARLFRTFDVSVDAQYDTGSGTLLLGARVGFSFGWNAARRRYALGRPGLARSGSVLVSAFRDIDADGRRGPNEPAVSGLQFRSGGSEVTTDKDGNALLTGVGEGRPAEVALGTGSLDDPYLSPVREGLEFVPRPGRTHEAPFPVVTISEVEGDAVFVSASGSRGVANVRLHLVDAQGAIISAARTEYDGYFLFGRIPPGSYKIHLDEIQTKQLSIRLAKETTVTASPDGGLVEGLRVEIVEEKKD